MRFGPESIPGCKVWLDGFKYNATGGSINNIPNLGTIGGYFSQTGTNRPVYDRPLDPNTGRYWPNGIRYTRSSSQSLVYSGGSATAFNFVLSGPSTFFFVVAPTTGIPNGTSASIMFIVGGAVTNNRRIYIDNRAALPATRALGGSISGAVTLASFQSNGFQYAASTGKARSAYVLCSGPQRDKAYYAGTLQVQSGVYAYPGVAVSTAPSIGGIAGLYYDGHIGFLVVCEGILSTASLAFLEKNVSGLYGAASIQ